MYMNIKKLLGRLWINRFVIWKLACKITGSIFTLWGFVSLFEPLNDVFQDDASFACKLFIGALVLFAVFVISSITAALIVLLSNEVCLGESTTKNSIYVKYGDMHSPDIVEKGYKGKRAIVVPVNRCFDTIVDDHLISRNTQHGRVFQKLYDDQKFTPDSLNRTISEILDHNKKVYKEITLEEKPEGNRRRYDVGTTVNLIIDDYLSYYLLGLSYFDEHLNAHTSKADFAFAVQKLIEFCDQNAQGYPVILPLLGSGLSRTNIELKDILHYIVDAFAINRDIINNDFYIVVWKGYKDRVSIKELRKWK